MITEYSSETTILLKYIIIILHILRKAYTYLHIITILYIIVIYFDNNIFYITAGDDLLRLTLIVSFNNFFFLISMFRTVKNTNKPNIYLPLNRSVSCVFWG
jgi:hypothetical protein